MVNCKCGRTALYGTQMGVALYCGDCKTQGSYNVVSRRCVHPGCMVIPSYGKEGSNQKKYCKTHKPEGYVNIQAKRCTHPGCTKHATNRKNINSMVQFCAKHSPKDYENTTMIMCKAQGCTKYASFTKIGFRKREYCAKHRPDGYEIFNMKRDIVGTSDALSRCRGKIKRSEEKLRERRKQGDYKKPNYINIRYESIQVPYWEV